MEEKINEQTEPMTQTVEMDKEKGVNSGEASLGKFKDVESLMNAYNSLQSEFTKRCQKIKELENAISADKVNTPTSESHSESVQEDTTPVDKNKILKDYLLEVLGKKPTAIVMDGTGVGVKAPVQRPKNINEAGKLAEKIFNK